jgi:hypothetical protein
MVIAAGPSPEPPLRDSPPGCRLNGTKEPSAAPHCDQNIPQVFGKKLRMGALRPKAAGGCKAGQNEWTQAQRKSLMSNLAIYFEFAQIMATATKLVKPAPVKVSNICPLERRKAAIIATSIGATSN